MEDRRRGSYAVTAVVCGLLATLLAACATLPPAKSVSGVQEIAGTWEGSGRTARGSLITIRSMAIRPDGTWEAEIPGATPPRHNGMVRLEGGKLRSHSNTSGNNSTWTLHEGEGKRVLKSVNDDGGVTIELTPVKK